MTQWDFQNKGMLGWTGTSSFVLEVPLRHLRPSVIYSVPCDQILQRAHLQSKNLGFLGLNKIRMRSLVPRERNNMPFLVIFIFFYPHRISRGQRVIISKRQGLCRTKLCGIKDLRPAVSQRLL